MTVREAAEEVFVQFLLTKHANAVKAKIIETYT